MTTASAGINFNGTNSFVILTGRTLNLPVGQTATFGATGAGFYLGGGAVFNNAGTFLAQNNGGIVYNFGSGNIFNNSGTFTRDTSAGIFSVGVAFNNTGTVNVQSGTIAFNGGLTVNGATALFDIGASHSATATTVTLDGGGSITGTGTSGVTATASFEMKSGAVGAILQGSGIPLNKTTAGTVTLTGANTYTGATTAGGGVLRLDSASALPGGLGNTGGTSRLIFNGGVLGLGNGDFNRGLGTGAAQAEFTGSGGFAAFTANRSVNLGGAGAGVTWGTGSFVPAGSTLILGAATADATVTFQNPINLGAAVRTVQVDDGSAATDGKLTGALTSSAGGGLTKTGAGTLNLDSATQSYNALTASAGTTNVNGTLGTLPGLAVVTVSPNAQLKFGTVSQTLASLSIGAGATVTFTSGLASFADSGDGKTPGFTADLAGNTAVPEPGTIGLLLTAALGVMGRRRRGVKG